MTDTEVLKARIECLKIANQYSPDRKHLIKFWKHLMLLSIGWKINHKSYSEPSLSSIEPSE